MEFRRIPFQFSSTDPAKRQAELQKRFGLPPKQEMYIDLANPGLMGAQKLKSNSASSSPRLQHRVPVFVEGMPESEKSDANPINVDAGQKPRVRIVPIEIEKPDGSKRHRTVSGSSCVNGNSYHVGSWDSNVNSNVEPSYSVPPNELIIPVTIEGAKTTANAKASATTPGRKKQTPKVSPVLKNGCNVTKVGNPESNKVLSPAFAISLKKIDTVLEKLKGYQSDVEVFSGTVKDKQYRYLDEMLTRLMLDLDNVETMGNEQVRLTRKAAIKKVQHFVDLLESKVNQSSQNQIESNAEVLDVQSSEEESKISVKENVELVAADSSSVEVPEVEMKDHSLIIQESEMIKSTGSQMELQLSIEGGEGQTICVVNELVAQTSENNKNLHNISESNLDISDENKQIQCSDLEQKSELSIPVEGVKLGEEELGNFKATEPCVSEIEMKEPLADAQELKISIETPEILTESCAERSMEIDTELNAIPTCDSCNVPSTITGLSAAELSSNVSDIAEPSVKAQAPTLEHGEQNKVNDKLLCEHIPCVEDDSSFEFRACKHSNITSVDENDHALV